MIGVPYLLATVCSIFFSRHYLKDHTRTALVCLEPTNTFGPQPLSI